MATDYRHTDKHLRLVMVLIALYCTRQSQTPNGSAVRGGTAGRTDGHYQVHYLPRFAVDNNDWVIILLTDA